MQVLIQYLFLFVLGALCGWVIEVVYRAIRHRKLVNPGFLSGPYLPLYGFGVMLLYFLCSLEYSFIKNAALQTIFILFVIMVSLTLVELLAGLIFVHGFKIKLWDYSDLKFNFMGIIHPVFSVVWGVLGAGYYFLVNPWLSIAAGWVSGNLIAVLLIGLTYGVFWFDLFSSFKVGTQIKATATKLRIKINYEELKRKYKEKLSDKHTISWFFNPFKHVDFFDFSAKFKDAIIESKIIKKIISKAKQKQDENEIKSILDESDKDDSV